MDPMVLGSFVLGPSLGPSELIIGLVIVAVGADPLRHPSDDRGGARLPADLRQRPLDRALGGAPSLGYHVAYLLYLILEAIQVRHDQHWAPRCSGS